LTFLPKLLPLGGKETFFKGPFSTNAIKNTSKFTEPSIKLGSLSINLPRLALESSKDETYFRARLVLLMKPAIAAMATRKKDVSDLIRRGVNPILAEKTQFMQKNNTSIILNLVGLKEAVYKILGHKDDKEGKEILNKVLETAVDIAHKKGQEMGVDVSIAMVNSDELKRFVTLDSEKYGKNSIMDVLEGDLYSQGLELNAAELDKSTAKTEIISEYNKISKTLDGGLLIKLPFDAKAKDADIKKTIEKASSLISSFKPIKNSN
jgi:Oxygen-sensitive ribonucleoside-triphosphate reductase